VSGNGYLVSKPNPKAGIGSRLLELGETVWLGREFGRAVIVDWRNTRFLKDKALNYFTEVFAPVPEILGVPMCYAPSPALRDYEQRKGERHLLDRALAERLVSEPESAPRYVVARHSDKLHRLPTYEEASCNAFLPDFYRNIVPLPHVAEQLEAWYDANLRGHVVVGVNVSTGNGLFAKGATYEGRVNVRIFENEERFLRTIESACEWVTKNIPPTQRSDYRIFFATDSAHMSEVLSRLPRAVTRRTVFPPLDTGHYFRDYDALGYSDRAAEVDTVIDMLLLARCDALVRNRSKFSHYALVSTGHFDGKVLDFEEVYPSAGAKSGPRAIRADAHKAAATR
jgi:hypothetical protein